MGHDRTGVSSEPAGPGARHSLPGQLVRVALAGAAGWAVDTAVLTSASAAGAPVVLASAAGLACGAVVNFLLNRMTFGGPVAARTAVARYAVLYLVNVVVVSAAVDAGLHLAGQSVGHAWAVVGAKVLATAVMLPVNTLAYRRWVFR